MKNKIHKLIIMILKPLQWIIIKNYYLSLIASFFYKKIFPKKLNSTEKKKKKNTFCSNYILKRWKFIKFKYKINWIIMKIFWIL